MRHLIEVRIRNQSRARVMQARWSVSGPAEHNGRRARLSGSNFQLISLRSSRMRILAMVTGDFRNADSGSRLRDYHLCSALSSLGDLDVLAFAPHQDVAGPSRDLKATVIVDRAPLRPVALLRSLARGIQYHADLFDPRRHKGFSKVRDAQYDLIYASMVYAMPAAAELKSGGNSSDALVVWDTHNYDPDVWKQMAANAGLLRRLVARRQVGPSSNAVVAAGELADIVLACTDGDAAKLKEVTRGGSVHVVPNGGETDHWSEAGDSIDPAPSTCVVFGTLRQHSTRRGLEWFLDDVWPRVRDGAAEAALTVAGRDPASGLARKVAATPGARLVANPEDLAATVAESHVIAVPQATGTGSKVKMFSALATGRPIVASSVAVTGIPKELLESVAVVDNGEAWSAAILEAFRLAASQPERSLGKRTLVENSDWSSSTDRLLTVLSERLGRSGAP